MSTNQKAIEANLKAFTSGNTMEEKKALVELVRITMLNLDRIADAIQPVAPATKLKRK